MGQITGRQAGAGVRPRFRRRSATSSSATCPGRAPRTTWRRWSIRSSRWRPGRTGASCATSTGQATIEVTPSVKGLATIHDKDVLIYCVSQLMAALNEGRPTEPRAAPQGARPPDRHQPRDLRRRLPAAARGAWSGCRGRASSPTSRPAGSRSTRGFGLIDAWEILRKTRGGRMILVTVTLSDWMYRSVVSKSVLTLHRDYFHLRKPLERRVYEIARKHCGRQAEWRIGLEMLLKKIRLDLAAAGVPQDDPRHGRGGRAARLQRSPSTADDVLLVRSRDRGSATGSAGAAPATRGSRPRRMPAPARRRRATIPTGSRRSGCGSGAAAAARRSGARRRPSSPSAAPAPPARRSPDPTANVPRAERRLNAQAGWNLPRTQPPPSPLLSGRFPRPLGGGGRGKVDGVRVSRWLGRWCCWKGMPLLQDCVGRP